MYEKLAVEGNYLRIAVLAEFFPPRMGSDRRIYELMRRLAEKNEINFLLFPPFREQCGMLNSETSNCPAVSTYVHEGIIVRRVKIPKIVQNLWRKSLQLGYILSMALLIPRVIRELVKVKPEIIILNYPSVYTGMLGFLAAKFLRRRCVVDFSDLIAQYTINLLSLKRSSLTGIMILSIQDYIVKRSDVVVTPTDFIRKYALALGLKDETISAVPNGVDMRVFNSEAKTSYRSELNLDDKKVCLFFGRLEEWAGIRILIEVCRVFEQKHQDVRFLVVGERSKEVEFPRNVVMVKEVPHHEVPKIIAIANVVLVPFPENEVSHAASPLRLFEAMAMRKAVIASRLSGIGEVIRNNYNGLLVDPNNPKEWFDVVETVLNSSLLQTRLGRNAEESVKKYDWNVLASQFEGILS
jgi:glycosyltransferase involved in cell wall biosynthesis